MSSLSGPHAPQGTRESAIRVSDLTRTFGDTTALDALSFEVGTGELFGIVGPDGSGKTTLLRILAGVMRPTSGEAVVDGVNVATDPESVKHHIAYMAQRFGLYGDLTVRENIEFYADLYGVPRNVRPERLDRLFAFSNLGHFQSRLAANLSGGMKQKLSLSCALIHEPRVLLLDEPTFGVDPISRRELWLIVHEMVARGTTAIVTTAYLDEAERCDRVALLDQGRVAALDTPTALQQRLVGRNMAIDCTEPRKAIAMIRGMAGIRSVALYGQSIHVTFDADARRTLVLTRLHEAGIGLRHAQPFDPSLEDVFIELTSDHVS